MRHMYKRKKRVISEMNAGFPLLLCRAFLSLATKAAPPRGASAAAPDIEAADERRERASAAQP